MIPVSRVPASVRLFSGGENESALHVRIHRVFLSDSDPNYEPCYELFSCDIRISSRRLVDTALRTGLHLSGPSDSNFVAVKRFEREAGAGAPNEARQIPKDCCMDGGN